MDGLRLADQPLPEGDRLRVRVVDAEDPDPVAGPGEDDVEERLPELAPVRGVEVQVVDVLVALGRVLGVLERAVGPAAEPLGMLARARGGRASTGGRGRARARARDPAAAATRLLELGEACRARGAIAVCPPSAAPIAHGLPGIAGPRDERVVRGPCGASARSGGSGGSRRRRSRARRAPAATASTPAKPPNERGKSSYQRAEARRARGRRSARAARRSVASASRGRSGRRRAPPRRVRLSTPEQRRALGELADESSGPPRACARARSATRRSGRSRPRSCTPSGRAGRPRTPRQRSLTERLHRRLDPALRARPAVRTTARRTSWPSAKMVARHLEVAAGRALDRIAAAVDLGETSWISIRGGRFLGGALIWSCSAVANPGKGAAFCH